MKVENKFRIITNRRIKRAVRHKTADEMILFGDRSDLPAIKAEIIRARNRIDVKKRKSTRNRHERIFLWASQETVNSRLRYLANG